MEKWCEFEFSSGDMKHIATSDGKETEHEHLMMRETADSELFNSLND